MFPLLSRNLARTRPALARSTRCMSQLQMTPPEARTVEHGPTFMSASEAFVETLVSQGVTDVFGIVGSAFMDALDLFPDAGIRFISVQHEQNGGHMADGYARISGRHGVCMAQNGPGITNFVTPVAAAYWAHSPVVAITPEAGTKTKGMGGFQEADQMPIFEAITKFQGHVNNASRIAEITSRAFDIAQHERGPVQVNIPRDLFYHTQEYSVPAPKQLDLPEGSAQSVADALQLLQTARNPVILAGGGVVMSGPEALASLTALAELLGAPVATTYLHNDAFPHEHPLAVGPLGYQGHQSAMHAIGEADVVLALGTRMNPFGTLPQYGIDYWPKDAKIIQVDIDSRRLGLTKEASVYVHGDAGAVARKLLAALKVTPAESLACLATKDERAAKTAAHKASWEKRLDEWTFERPALERTGRIRPRKALRALERAMPAHAMVATDIGNVCSVSNSYLRFNEAPSMLAAMTFGNCQYALGAAMGAKVAAPHRPAISYAGDGAWGMSLNEVLTCTREQIPVTAVVFHNEQWGAEKKNQVLWFGDRYVGVNLENPWSFAAIAREMNAEGIVCTHEDEVGDALRQATKNQMEDGKTTVVELMLTRELGDPFRRDAMNLPQRHLAKYMGTNEEQESATGQPVDL